MLWIGILAPAGVRIEHLLEDQNMTRLEIRVKIFERRIGRALGQTAALIAPGVELEIIVIGEQADRFHRLEDRLRLGAQLRVIRQHRGLVGNPREELRIPRGDRQQRRPLSTAPAPKRARCSRHAYGNRPAWRDGAPRRAGAPCRDKLRSPPRPADSSNGRRHRPTFRPTPRRDRRGCARATAASAPPCGRASSGESLP